MSWDVYVLKFDGKPSVDAMLAEGFSPLPLGTSEEVRRKISASFPAVDWTTPAWGDLDEAGYSIEFPILGEPIDSLILIVRGGGNPVPAITRFCSVNGWSAYDMGAGDFLGGDDPSRQSWRDWQAYRDQGVGLSQPDADEG